MIGLKVENILLISSKVIPNIKFQLVGVQSLWTPSLWAHGPRRPLFPHRLGRPQVEATRKGPHKSKWDHTRSHGGKVLEWSIIYCNSEIIFPTDMFGFLTCLLRISFQNCYLFVSHLLHCFLSKSSWSILTKIWKLARLSVTGLPTDLQDTAWGSDHFLSLTGGPNIPFRC